MINQNQKTLVFCATQRHAAMVRDMINQYNDSKNPNYCHRVTAEDGELGEKHLRDFQDNEKSIPTILTTSRKLSTGVDAPEVRNIILMRPVKSMVEFKQIVGRGTRLAEGKDYFTVYDFVKAHDHFNDDECMDPLKKLLQLRRDYAKSVVSHLVFVIDHKKYVKNVKMIPVSVNRQRRLPELNFLKSMCWK